MFLDEFLYMHLGIVPGSLLFAVKRGIVRITGKGKRLKALKGIHEGERCFLIGNAPSLTYEDLGKLRGEITFGCNSLCKAFPELGFSTTYFCFLDWRVYKLHKEIFEGMRLENVFYRFSFNALRGANPVWEKAIPFNSLGHYNYRKGVTRKFSTKPYEKVYDGYTVIYAMMQIAVYMGFKELYLLGVDCDYSGGKNNNHFVGSDTEHVTNSEINYAQEKMGQAFETAEAFAEEHGVRIFNCSRGGKLKVFIQKDLDEVLST